jgi:GTP:adenosylcobinamide-phosphate guanylyltransferase
MIVAAIMCGGKGSRMGQSSYIEKPLLRVKDKTMIEYVLHALVASKKFERIVGVSLKELVIPRIYLRFSGA